MTAAVPLPAHLLTMGEFAQLDEDEHHRWELTEGNLVMSPSPTPRHNMAVARIDRQVAPQLPADLEIVVDIDIDLQLAPPDQPGSARRPDLVIVERNAVERVEDEGGLLRASEVLVVMEVVSPGSRRIDSVFKRAEYAEAGIRHYWIFDIDHPISVLPCQLTKSFGYGNPSAVNGTFATSEPYPITIDLDRLR